MHESDSVDFQSYGWLKGRQLKNKIKKSFKNFVLVKFQAPISGDDAVTGNFPKKEEKQQQAVPMLMIKSVHDILNLL